MQAIMETLFDIAYLVGVILAGVLMVRRAGKSGLVKLFGCMAIMLGAGDAFHLLPRVYALWSAGGVAAHVAALGVGKAVTSITMTVFYLLLYYVWKKRYDVRTGGITTIGMWALAVLRIALCLFPQNGWLVEDAPLSWAILRNIPFLLMGIWAIILFKNKVKENQDAVFKNMPLAILLSFAFYIPVVLFADIWPIVGVLMIPKTLAYVWIVRMGWNLMKEPTRGLR